MTATRLTRRSVLKALVGSCAAPAVFCRHAQAAASEMVLHASFGAAGQALADLRALTRSKHLKVVAVADVDLARTNEVRKLFPEAKVYQDWRELLDKEKNLNSVNISTPDHMHAAITMRALRQGLHAYTQKPLTQTLYEARQLTRAAAEKKLVTQMGIQIHSAAAHRAIPQIIQAGTIGKVKEVHAWSGKRWGDRNPRPERTDPVPETLNWDHWLGVAAERPFLKGYYHPGEWRKRLDFGTGTFGDMGCHILDPVFSALALTAPATVRSTGGAPNGESWGLDSQVHYRFPATAYTAETLNLHWYDGARRPPDEVQALLGTRKLSDQGSIYLGTNGVLYSPYGAGQPMLLPVEKFQGFDLPKPGSQDHYLQFVEAVRGNGQTSTPFSYSGPLTEVVLLGCLATRFPQQTLEWDAVHLKVTNVAAANEFVRRKYRMGWEVDGL